MSDLSLPRKRAPVHVRLDREALAEPNVDVSIRRLGRPRDESLAERILEAAVEIYTELGWAGFNLDVVSKRAKVGKAPLYSRWANREDLLFDAFKRSAAANEFVPQEKSLRGNLMALGHHVLDIHAKFVRTVIFWSRIHADMILYEGVFRRIDEEIIQKRLDAFRRIVTMAIEAGEIEPGESSRLLLDVFAGGLINHILYLPAGSREAIAQDGSRIVDRFTNWVLAAVKFNAEAGRHESESE